MTQSIGQVKDRAAAVYAESRRRGADAVDALAGRRRKRNGYVAAAVAVGALAGATVVIAVAGLGRRLPDSARRRVAVTRARLAGDPVGALIESARGAGDGPARTPILVDAPD